MCGFGSKSVLDVVDAQEQEHAAIVIVSHVTGFHHGICSPWNDATSPQPGKDNCSNSSAIVLVIKRRFAMLVILIPPERFPAAYLTGPHISDMGLVCCRDDRDSQRGCKMEDNGEDSADFPGNSHALRFFAFRPEEIEEEGGAEDERNEHACEDVVRGCSDVVVVGYCNAVLAEALDYALAGCIIYIKRYQLTLCGWGKVDATHQTAHPSQATPR